MSVCEFFKNGIFRYFGSIDNGYAFIILFEASNSVVNNRENSHRKSIKQADFRDINPLRRTVVQ